MARGRAAGEGLNDDHMAAATRTRRRGRRLAICGIGMLGLRGWHGEELANAREVVGAGGLGEQAEVADAVKTLRQDMDEEAADELMHCERHPLVASAAVGAIVFVFEGDALAVECDQRLLEMATRWV